MRHLSHNLRMLRFLNLSMVLAALALAAASCGASHTGLAAASQSVVHQSPLPAPHLYAPDGQLRSASGPPAGIHLSWGLVSDPGVQGYYLYRDSQPIPVPPPNETINPALRVNGGNLVPQPPSGTEVPFDDLFTPTVGTLYHYRVTTVDLNSDESYPSNEITYAVTGQHITNVTPLAGFYGDQLTITGDTFGPPNLATDSVLFPAALGGTVAGGIVSWAPTQIKVSIPVGAKSGPVTVAINGYEVSSAQSITISNPVITGFTPVSVFVGQQLTLSGVGFGATKGSSTLKLGSQDLTAAVTTWADTSITVPIAVGTVPGNMVVHVGTHDSNPAPFSPRAEILDTSPFSAVSNSIVALHGRYFGTGTGSVTVSAPAAVDVIGWSDVSISVRITGAPGTYQLTVHPAGAPLPGNDFPFEVLTPLTVQLTGVTNGTVCRASEPPALGVATPSTTEKIELLLNGNVVSTSTTVPFSDLALPFATAHNARYTLTARATRGIEVVSSAPLQIDLVSLDGDVNGDGKVDLVDRDVLLILLGLTTASPSFRGWYDTNADGVVNEADLSQVGYHFGQSQ